MPFGYPRACVVLVAGLEPAYLKNQGITPGRPFPWITRFPTDPFGEVRCFCNHGVLRLLAPSLVTVPSFVLRCTSILCDTSMWCGLGDSNPPWDYARCALNAPCLPDPANPQINVRS